MFLCTDIFTTTIAAAAAADTDIDTNYDNDDDNNDDKAKFVLCALPFETLNVYIIDHITHKCNFLASISAQI